MLGLFGYFCHDEKLSCIRKNSDKICNQLQVIRVFHFESSFLPSLFRPDIIKIYFSAADFTNSANNPSGRCGRERNSGWY